MIVLDASVLIAYLEGEDRHHRSAEALFERSIEEDFAVNPLTLAEVLVAPARAGRLEPVLAALGDLEIQELPFPADTAVQLAQLRASTGLKLPDCCVLLAAEHAGASVASFDGRLVQAARKRGLPVLRS